MATMTSALQRRRPKQSKVNTGNSIWYSSTFVPEEDVCALAPESCTAVFGTWRDGVSTSKKQSASVKVTEPVVDTSGRARPSGSVTIYFSGLLKGYSFVIDHKN